jgi:parallel beta-helix repeat protein
LAFSRCRLAGYRFGATAFVTILAAVIPLLGFTSPVAAQIQCGDIIGPNETVTLQNHVGPCDANTGGLTVIGPAELNLNGFLVFCDPFDPSPPDASVIKGQKAKVHNGFTPFCFDGVKIDEQGQHRVEKLVVQTSSAAGMRIKSDKNRVVQDLVLLGTGTGIGDGIGRGSGDGITVFGNRNRLIDNTVESNARSGFLISGRHNTFLRNTADGP